MVRLCSLRSRGIRPRKMSERMISVKINSTYVKKGCIPNTTHKKPIFALSVYTPQCHFVHILLTTLLFFTLKFPQNLHPTSASFPNINFHPTQYSNLNCNRYETPHGVSTNADQQGGMELSSLGRLRLRAVGLSKPLKFGLWFWS